MTEITVTLVALLFLLFSVGFTANAVRSLPSLSNTRMIWLSIAVCWIVTALFAYDAYSRWIQSQ